ncbi:unnamed protein product [Musa acuminata var. zebrina]
MADGGLLLRTASDAHLRVLIKKSITGGVDDGLWDSGASFSRIVRHMVGNHAKRELG